MGSGEAEGVAGSGGAGHGLASGVDDRRGLVAGGTDAAPSAAQADGHAVYGQKVFREHGLPERLHSDNGSPFASGGAERLSKLPAWWLKLSIELERIQPGKPQQNGRRECMHRVLKAETALADGQPRPATGAL